MTRRPRGFEASADSGAAAPAGNAYLTLCFGCGTMLELSPTDAVLAEARAIVGDLTIAFCGECIRQAASRMVDEA
jgi:hypothetical protein